MHQNFSKNLILNLIKDDLKHQHTVLGLQNLGFNNDNSMLNICSSIFAMMGLRSTDPQLEHLTNEYCERTVRVAEIAVDDTKAFERLAEEVYAWLESECVHLNNNQ